LLVDLAQNESDRQVLKFMSTDNAYGRPFATTPDVPPDRVAALRRAFDLSMKDADLLAEAKQADLKLTPSSGEEVQHLVAELMATPKDVSERTKDILSEATRLQRVQ
jgi:tripartite-type tricarboxylate transporter receptor subunit TctC